MYFLGINYYGHNTSCSLFKNGRLLFAIEEERLSRIKNDTAFPVLSIKFCLNKFNLKINDIKLIGAATIPQRLLRKKYIEFPLSVFPKANDYSSDKTSMNNMLFLSNAENNIRNKLNYKGDIKFFHHHLCHLSSSFFLSGFKRSCSVSLDGVGEIESSAIAISDNKNTKIIETVNYPNSLGMVYSAITFYLGYKTNSSEGTVMALAALGNRRHVVPNTKITYQQIFNKIIKIKKNGLFEIDTTWFNYPYTRKGWVSDKFLKIFGLPRKHDSKLLDKHKDIASALQKRFEEAYIAYINRAFSITKIPYLTLSGGCALNCKANGLIQSKTKFKDVYIQPAAGDNGLSIGSGYLAYLTSSKIKYKPFYHKHTYFGPEYSNHKIINILKNRKINFKIYKNIHDITAELLLNKKIIGWFQGRMEFGPRALGNRSIISSPFPVTQKNIINKQVKHREYFRPFAPAILIEEAKKYFNLKFKSPFMLFAVSSNKSTLTKAPAIVHYDGSARVQTVEKSVNLNFYKLIKQFYNKSGVPILLNTSFNDKGEPVVCSPEDALNTFFKTKIDFLVMNNILIKK